MENEILRVRVEPPLGQMPPEIARALFGRAEEAPIAEPEFAVAVETKFGYFAEPPAAFKSDEAEEAELALRHPFESKLLATGVATTPAPFTLPEPFYVAPNDFNEDAEYANPIKRLFYNAASAVAGASPAKAPEPRFKIAKETVTPPAETPNTDELAKLAKAARENSLRDYVTRSIGDAVFKDAAALADYTEDHGHPEEAEEIRALMGLTKSKRTAEPDDCEAVTAKMLEAFQACGVQGDEESDTDFIARFSAELTRLGVRPQLSE